MKKHQEHIVCIKSEKVQHRKNGFVDYNLNNQDLMLGQRFALESDEDFRQLLPISIFTYNGKVWAYERTSKGGESRLHNKIAVAVGGHAKRRKVLDRQDGVDHDKLRMSERAARDRGEARSQLWHRAGGTAVGRRGARGERSDPPTALT